MTELDKDSHQVSFPIAQAGFSHALELATLSWLKSDKKQKILQMLWAGFYVDIKPLLQQNPAEVFSDIGNLLNNLFSSDADFPVRWVKLMTSVSPSLISFTLLQQTGLVCAWMSGLAHYRESALQQLESLPEALVRELFKLSTGHNIKQHIAAIEFNRWLATDDNQASHLQLQSRVGSCSLLDGNFPVPPQVFAFDDQFFVRSGNLAWRLYVDLFGSSLIPCDAVDLENTLLTSKQKQTRLDLNHVPELDDIDSLSSVARLPDTMAMTSAQTFAIMILSINDTPQAKSGDSFG
jgi:hypothetical protein